MIRPCKMKQVQMIVLKKDINTVIEFLGQREAMHFDVSDNVSESSDYVRIKELFEKLKISAQFLNIELPSQPDADSVLPHEADEALVEEQYAAIELFKEKETAVLQEKKQTEETFFEAKSFSNLNTYFSNLDQLSYLTLRVGRLDPKVRADLKQQLGERAIIIPLGEEEDGKVLAASSRKGRFALDSELNKYAFKTITVPENFQGVPAELLEGIQKQLNKLEAEINGISSEKEKMKNELQPVMQKLTSMFLTALAVEKLKSRCASTSEAFMLSGWVPADLVKKITQELSVLTDGRAAIRIYNPNEIPGIKNESEKIPVSLRHGSFVKGFERVVFSYGAPLYGTIDPTPIVAVFFILLFGIMFGDFGQGFVLLLIGLLTGKHGLKMLKRFKKFSVPLIAVGITSMVMGLLTGEVFTNEELLVAPTRAVTAALTGNPVDRIITIMPQAGNGNSIIKLFYFFGFTITIGVIFNSIGIIINIVNNCILRKYEAAFFSKTGIAGLLFFWYVIFIAISSLLGGSFIWPDFFGLLVPVGCIFFGPVLWRCIAREKPFFKHGIMTFIMEGFVEILETISSVISSSVSFLRVGAFALSHAVLSFIVFRFTEELINYSGGITGSLFAFFIIVFGNLVIIVLEGMIVAIQVMRLQYYEFFSKFFTSTGVEFTPFRFRN